MRFKGTIILLLILAALGGFVYYYEIKGGERRKEKEEAAKKLLAVDQSKIAEIDLIYPDKRINGVREKEHHWKITYPLQTEANDEAWDRIASNLADLQKEKVLDEHPKDLKEYGLDNPVLKVAAKFDGKTAEVLFGYENPTGSYVYTKLPQKPEVILTSSVSFNAFKKDLPDLREQAILRFNEFDVQEMRLKNQHGEFTLVKEEKGWQLKAPLEAKAEGATVSSLLNGLAMGKVKEYIDSNPPGAKETGLDRPTIAVVVLEGKDKGPAAEGAPAKGPSTKVQLLVGRSKNGELYYAKDESRKEVFLIEKAVFEKLDKSLFDLRDKTLVSFRRGEIDGIELSNGKEKIVLKKEQTNWLVKEPGAAGEKPAQGSERKAQFSKITAMFEALEKNKALEFIDRPQGLAKYGLEPPKVDVIFKKGEEVLNQFDFGSNARPARKLEESGPFCYFKNKAENDVKIISKEVLEKFKVSQSDLIQSKKEE